MFLDGEMQINETLPRFFKTLHFFSSISFAAALWRVMYDGTDQAAIQVLE